MATYTKTITSAGTTKGPSGKELGIDFTGAGGGQRSTAGPKSKTRAMRRAQRLTTPRTADLPETAGMDFRFPESIDYKTEWAQGEGNIDMGGDYDASAGQFSTEGDEFYEEFLDPVEEIYYKDYLESARDYYFEKTTPADILAKTDPSLDVSGIDRTTKAELPQNILNIYQTGTDSPYLNLRDVKEAAGTELEAAVEGIETEEENIQIAKDLYADIEEATGQEREAMEAEGILQEEQVGGLIAKSGYERGPADKQLELVQEAGEMKKGNLYKTKRKAQIERKEAIDTAEQNIIDHFDDAETAMKNVGRAESIYTGEMTGGPGSPFYDLAFDTVETAKLGMETVQKGIDDMFGAALKRAQETSEGMFQGEYTGTSFPFKESRFSQHRNTFKTALGTIEENIKNLGTFLPSAGEIASESVAPYMEDGEFDWLAEGYQDTVTY